MNDRKINPMFEDDIRRAFGSPDTRPEFAERLHADLLQRAAKLPAYHRNDAHRIRLGFAFGIAVLLLSVFFFKTPTGIALAGTIRRLFTLTTATEIPISNLDQVATPTFAPTFAAKIVEVTAEETETPAPTQASVTATPSTGFSPQIQQVCEQDPYGYTCKIAWAEKRIGYDLKELPGDPEGWKYSEINVAENMDVSIIYERIGGGSYLYLFQGLGSEISSMYGSVPEESIQEVWVGDQRGEYVVGMFTTTGDPPVYNWNPSSRFRLRWTDGERWYEFDQMGCVGAEDCNKPKYLINLATQLVNQPGLEETIRADFLKSAEEASRISGFTIMEPDVLPQDFEFRYGTYDETKKQVSLHYAPTGYDAGVADLTLVETRVEDVRLAPGENGQELTGENVDINGQRGVYFSDSPYNHSLTWESRGLQLTLTIYSSDLWYGGSFTKEQVLDIARSIQ